MIVEGRSIMENLRRACVEEKKTRDQLVADLEGLKRENLEQKEIVVALIEETDTMRWTVAKDQKLKEEMGEAIILEHTRGFKKALRQVSHLLNVSTDGVKFDPRKDVYQGQLVPLGDIPAGTFLDDEPAEMGNECGIIIVAAVSGEMGKENPATPSTTDVVIVNIS
ncbi:uncharacterized protein LOC106771687 [Vigna radiata var. radiata]|uniref:Uncharacterized protein LOC106771687 n=1 Tax=Vigna radiata var. radiata TaxID=3916 RepID=A0A1S3V4R1_VIGRR|nr:uncharacterized protein LOC106771687 [Vigna radiata var. radiata]XP_014513178.1 uncharacterized protein LOC106771687 [Vigna radiata var. radiata]XP_022640601.1 uncharacterized protein LOC106771687 [Vigna radiata var. radiata]